MIRAWASLSMLYLHLFRLQVISYLFAYVQVIYCGPQVPGEFHSLGFSACPRHMH